MSIGKILTELHSRLIGLDSWGNLLLDTKDKSTDSGKLPFGFPQVIGKGIPSQIGISYAKGGSANIVLVTFQLQDCFGNAVAGGFNMDVSLSDAATGLGLTATTASGGFAAGASGGTIFGTFTASKAAHVQTNATGAFILAITDTAKTGFYPVATFPGFPAIVGAQLVAANYD